MAVLPAIPSVPDQDRYSTTTVTVATGSVGVPFPVYGNGEDLTVKLNGAPLSTQSWGFSSASGQSPDTMPLPITDGLINFFPPAVGVIEIIGNWQPRQPAMATAPGIARREFNQIIGTIISGMRETARSLRNLLVPALAFNAAGPIANRPAAGAVAANFIYLQTDDAQNRIVFWISDGVSVWTPLVGTGPQGTAGTNGNNGLNGTSISLKNRLINGNFAINQRGYVTATALSAGTYAHDRWKAGVGGANYTFTQGALDTLVTIAAGSLQQVIEGASVEGGAYVLSWTGNAQGRINGGAYANSPIAIGGLTPGAAVTVEFGTGTLGTVQLEPGATASAFERRPIGYEQALCARYFQWLPVNYAGSNAYGPATVYSQLMFSPMRAVPTAGAIVADPNLTQSSSGLSSYKIDLVTPYGAAISLVPTGNAVVLLGYRASLSAEL